MSKYCPIANERVLYLTCMECEEKECNKNMFYCIITGLSNFSDYALFTVKTEYYLRNIDIKNVIIITGDKNGTDAMARKYAKKNGITCRVFSDKDKMVEYALLQKKKGAILFQDDKNIIKDINIRKKMNVRKVYIIDKS